MFKSKTLDINIGYLLEKVNYENVCMDYIKDLIMRILWYSIKGRKEGHLATEDFFEKDPNKHLVYAMQLVCDGNEPGMIRELLLINIYTSDLDDTKLLEKILICVAADGMVMGHHSLNLSKYLAQCCGRFSNDVNEFVKKGWDSIIEEIGERESLRCEDRRKIKFEVKMNNFDGKTGSGEIIILEDDEYLEYIFRPYTIGDI